MTNSSDVQEDLHFNCLKVTQRCESFKQPLVGAENLTATTFHFYFLLLLLLS